VLTSYSRHIIAKVVSPRRDLRSNSSAPCGMPSHERVGGTDEENDGERRE